MDEVARVNTSDKWLDGKEPMCQCRRLQIQFVFQEIATCSRILAWEIPWTEKPSGLHNSPWGCNIVGHDLVNK